MKSPGPKSNTPATTEMLENLKIPDEKTKCAHCGNDQVSLRCSGCLSTPSKYGTHKQTVTSYCNKECQKTDWQRHRQECRKLQKRKMLFRAGSLLQKIWYTLRRECFDNCVVRAEEVNGQLLIQEGDYMTMDTKRPNGWFREFPESIFKDDNDREACLSLMFCTESLGYMHGPTSWLLEDVFDDVKEVSVMVMRAPRLCRYTDLTWDKQYIHELLQVRQGEETYAVDFTGAQYGWFKPVNHWSGYEKCCILDSEKCPVGTTAALSLERGYDTDLAQWGQMVLLCGEILKKGFKKAFEEEVVKQHGRGSDLLKLHEPVFEAASTKIVTTVKRVVDEATEKIDALMPFIRYEAGLTFYRMTHNFNNKTKHEILMETMEHLMEVYYGRWRRNQKTGGLEALDIAEAQGPMGG